MEEQGTWAAQKHSEAGYGRGCHKDAHPFFFYYGIYSLMAGRHQIQRYLSW